MTGYNELAKLSVFTVSDIVKLTNNVKTAYSLLDRLMKKGFVKKISNNIYSCVNAATGQIIASRYQIACAKPVAQVQDGRFANRKRGRQICVTLATFTKIG